jgi:radical SAM superfamily enzyme YgiQ (UPF0313 family)
MRVLLIEPPLSVTKQGIFPRHPPQYALYSAAVLREAGTEVSILDAFLEDLDINETVERVLEVNPDLTLLLPFDYTRETEPRVTIELVRRIHGAAPHMILGLGGSVDAGFLRQCMDDAGGLSFAICGEYELAMARIAAHGGTDLSAIPGLLVRDGGRVVETGAGDVVEDLDKLPFPAWDLIDFKRYTFVPHRYRRTPMYPLLASRGCPFACLCCKEATYSKIIHYRLRSVPDVLREIRFAIERYGAREIQFSDATFGIRKEWVFELCDGLEREKLDVTWSALMRANLMTPDVLERMAATGCWNVLVGVESANQHALDRVGKGITPDLALKAVRAARDAGIEVTASFILGLPGEDRADVLRTIDLAIDLAPDYAQFFLWKYYGLENPFADCGRLDDTWDLSQIDFRGPVFIPNGFRDKAELKELQRFAYRRFYLRPAYVWRRLPDLLSFEQMRRSIRGVATLLKTCIQHG